MSQRPIMLDDDDNPYADLYVYDTNYWVDYFGLFGDEFAVGIHIELLRAKKDPNLRSHHVGQKAIMKDMFANDEMKAPAILVNKMGHNNNKPGFEPGTVSRSRINPRTNRPFTNARELLARDIRELRRVYPDIPNSKLKELIDLNKKMYPEMRKPAKGGHH